MKKIGIVMAAIVITTALYLMYGNNDNEDLKFARIPHCIVNGSTYFTHDPRNPDDYIPDDYAFYGTIVHKVEGHETSTIDLTTNTPEYYEKAVFVNQRDHSVIYIKLDEHRYLKLWKDGNDHGGNIYE